MERFSLDFVVLCPGWVCPWGTYVALLVGPGLKEVKTRIKYPRSWPSRGKHWDVHRG